MANTRSFTIGDSVNKAWEITKKNIWFLLGVEFLAFFVPRIVLAGTPRFAQPGMMLLSFVYQLIVGIGMIVIALKLLDGRKPVWKELYTHYDLFINYFVAVLLMGLCVFLGFIALVLPGIYIALRLSLTTFYVVDRKLGPVDALKASWAATSGNVLHLLGLIIVYWGIMLLGALALGVGVFVAIPVVLLTNASIYRQLSGGK
ncbi:MAG TPA: hypothetical protein VLH19_00225 [Patescibacteria group bacterium]|nr:hypothetical protein [Patescibacteria group bacterium]